jgi:hypothetical protein
MEAGWTGGKRWSYLSRSGASMSMGRDDQRCSSEVRCAPANGARGGGQRGAAGAQNWRRGNSGTRLIESGRGCGKNCRSWQWLSPPCGGTSERRSGNWGWPGARPLFHKPTPGAAKGRYPGNLPTRRAAPVPDADRHAGDDLDRYVLDGSRGASPCLRAVPRSACAGRPARSRL